MSVKEVAYASKDRYNGDELVLLRVPHYRICDGETDEVIKRTYTAEVESKIREVFECKKIKMPDWFLEHWIDDDKQLVEVLVFKSVEDADAFKSTINKEGKNYIWDDIADKGRKTVFDEVLTKVNNLWQEAHAEAVKRLSDAFNAGLENGIADRTLILSSDVEVEDGEDFDGAIKKLFDGFNESIHKLYNANEDAGFIYSSMFSEEVKKVFVVMCFKEQDEANKMFDEDSVDLCWKVRVANEKMFSERDDDMPEMIFDAIRKMCAALMDKEAERMAMVDAKSKNADGTEE